MKRADVLKTAMKCVCGGREQDHGTPENNFALIGRLWTAYTGIELCAKDVAVMMALLKIARIKTGSSEDSYCDLAGYAACACEIATEHEEQSSDDANNSTDYFRKATQDVKDKFINELNTRLEAIGFSPTKE